ncbi:hypothetical protein H4R35_001237 [Dimargaris xerosporica]|nr:hypothetical protein H4R35_001237 [Dimargaris xerosporica]
MPNIERIRDLREERPKTEEELAQWQERFLKDQRPPAARVVTFSTHRSTIERTDAAYRQAAPGVNRAPVRVMTESCSNGPDGDTGQGDEIREILMTPLKAALVADHVPTEAKIFPATETPADATAAASLPMASPFGRDVISRPIGSSTSPIPASSMAPATRTRKPGKKKSLFAQRREQQSKQHTVQDQTPAAPGVMPKAPRLAIPQDPALALDKPLEDPMSYNQIHIQNMQALAAMSADEVYEAQAEIRKLLSSETIDYLLNKNAKPSTSVSAGTTAPPASTAPNSAITHASMTSKCARSDGSQSSPADDGVSFFNHLKTEYFSNVPTEHDKMEWMGMPNPIHQQASDQAAAAPTTASATAAVSPHTSNNLPASQSQPASSTTATTSPVSEVPGSQWRFDFRGLVVPPKSDLPVHLGLHHHGHDPEEAGYTLTELLHLTQSAFPAQRVIPLRTLGRVLARCREAIFNPPAVTAMDHNEGTQQTAIPKDETAPKEDPLPRHHPYTTDMAAEILQGLQEARFPQCLMNILSGSHRTSVLSTLDTVALWLTTAPDASSTGLAAEDRLAPRTVYQTFAEWSLVPRLVELLGHESPVVLAPLSRLQALEILEAMLHHCPNAQSHLTNSADALEALLQTLVSESQSVGESKGVDLTVAGQKSLVAQRLLDAVQKLKTASSPPG